MKIILTTDVPKVGNRYDIKELKDGYANVLINKGLAQFATPKVLADLNSRKIEIKKKKEKEAQVFDSMISSINNKKIEIKIKANEKGHLFKSVGPKDVVMAIKDITGIEIEENSIIMNPIKELGSHFVEIKRGDKNGKCEIIIIKT